MRVTHLKYYLFPRHLNPIPDTNKIQALLKSITYSLHHVGKKTAGQPVKGAMKSIIGGTGNRYDIVVQGDRDYWTKGAQEFSLGPLHRHLVSSDTDLNPLRQGDRHFSDS
jgi:hypothetical protein